MAVIAEIQKEYPHLFNAELETKVQAMIEEAIRRNLFLQDALTFGVTGLSEALMRQYLENVADQRLSQMGFQKRYLSKNPFPFMVLQDAPTPDQLL